jgi:hypothetical protein
MTATPIALTMVRAFNSSAQKSTREGEADEAFSLMVDGFSEHMHSPQDGDSTDVKGDPGSVESADGAPPDVVCAALCAVVLEQQRMTVPADLPELTGKARSAAVPFLAVAGQPFLPGARPLLPYQDFILGHTSYDAEVPDSQLARATEQAEFATLSIGDSFANDEAPGVGRSNSMVRLDVEAAPEEAAAVSPVAVSDESVRDEVPPALQILSQIGNALSVDSGLGTEGTAARQILPLFPTMSPSSELKSIRFMLRPAHLGDVEVTLRRSGAETKVTIAVASRAVAEVLSRDMSILEDRLGSLLAPGTGNAVNVTMEIRDPGSSQGQQAEPPEGQGTSDFGPAGGHGFGREGRSESGSDQRPLTFTRDELNEVEIAERPAAGSRRVV